MDTTIGHLILIAVIVFVAIPAPLFIVLHFITRWKESREISGGDEQMLEDLWQMALRMEERLESLKIILDNEIPKWRKNNEQRIRQDNV